jgi:tight adherence protein C
MTRPLVAATLIGWVGVTLVLSRSRWFARRDLTTRLRPYVTRSVSVERPDRSAWSVETVRAIVAPIVEAVVGSIANAAGVRDSVAVRMRRAHLSGDPSDFRLKQLAWAAGALAASAAIVGVARPASAPAVMALIGAPLLAVLVVEQSLVSASTTWKRRLVAELPVVCEQIGMLLSSGYSLSATLARLASRSDGAIARDLRRVLARMRTGIDEATALREWSDLAQVDGVRRLVAVLALNRETTDLGRLISDEARALRRDEQRRLIEQIERRSQLVWIPVTVAALVPGVLFISIPFISIMRSFAA